MDEPTAALDRDDAARLLDLVKRLSAEGVSIIYVSHRMPEIKTIADRVTVLKDGRTVMTAPIAEAPTGRLVRAMVGRDLADFYPPRAAKPPGAPALVIRGGANDHLANIDLTVRAGEIVGVAGLEGAGKSALGRAIAGDEPFEKRDGGDRGQVADAPQPARPRSKRESAACRRTASAKACSCSSRCATTRPLSSARSRAPFRAPKRRHDVERRNGPAAHTAGRARGKLRAGGRTAVGRQPAEGHRRPLAGARSASSCVQRADARNRRRRESGDLQDHARPRRPGSRDPDDFLRPSRDRRRQRSHCRHARGPHRWRTAGRRVGGGRDGDRRRARRSRFCWARHEQRRASSPPAFRAGALRRRRSCCFLALSRFISASRFRPGRPRCSRSTAWSVSCSAWSRWGSSRSGKPSSSSPDRSTFRSPI